MTQIQTVPAKVQFKQFTDVFLQPAENNAGLKALLSPFPSPSLQPFCWYEEVWQFYNTCSCKNILFLI